MALYVIRHGRTEANAAGLLQGRLDPPLDDVGRAQAASLVGALPPLDRLVCSPLRRARETASVFGMEPQIDERWIEVAYGVYEGTPVADVPKDVWQQWIDDPAFAPEGGESLRSLESRIGRACASLIEEARDKEIAVVSHATPVKAAMAWALGVDISITWRSFVDQASITRIVRRERGPSLAAFNITPWSTP
jgi:alpha-ribazole phosphatase